MIKTFTKKILPLSLLLISFLIPLSGIQAQIIGAPGTCSVSVAPRTVTEENCRLSGGIWTPSGSGTGGPIIVSPPGSCSIPFYNSPGACTQNSGIWCTSPKIPKDGKCVDAGTSSGSASKSTYNFLAPLKCADGVPGCVDGKLVSFDPAGDKPLSKYLNIMIRIVIGIAAVLAMIMIVVGGIQYMTSELISSKEEGKKRISNAILGLIIALGSYVLLFMVNPDLLKVEPGLESTFLEFEESESSIGFVPISSAALAQSGGISCPGSGGVAQLATLARTFLGHTTYSQAKKNQTDPSIPTAYLDCSSFVAQVYKCAGLPSIFTGGCTSTACIFAPGSPRLFPVSTVTSSGGSAIVNNNYELRPGDLLGWRAVDAGTAFGHVVMYIGNGQFIDSRGPSVEKKGPIMNNKAIHISSSIYSKIKWLKKASP
jgi:hypothetical protein